jgi:hypothetical protein
MLVCGMTLTRRQTLIVAAVTVAAAAVAKADDYASMGSARTFLAAHPEERRCYTTLRVGHSKDSFDAGIGDWYAEIGSKTVWQMTPHGWQFQFDWEPAA